MEWLDAHGIPFCDLCFMKEKDQVGADIYIEDNPDNIDRLRKSSHYTICFRNSTNPDIAQPSAANWDEVYELIHEYAPMSS